LSDNIYNKSKAIFIDLKSNQEFANNPPAENGEYENRFYQVMAQTFFDPTKLTDFKNYILNSTVYGEKKIEVEIAINAASQACSNLFNQYTTTNNERYLATKIKEKETYKNLTKNPIDAATSYKLNYTFTTDGTQQQKKRILDLYSTNNINESFKTFDGKIKFN
jgi:hypothetical protein